MHLRRNTVCAQEQGMTLEKLHKSVAHICFLFSHVGVCDFETGRLRANLHHTINTRPLRQLGATTDKCVLVFGAALEATTN